MRRFTILCLVAAAALAVAPPAHADPTPVFEATSFYGTQGPLEGIALGTDFDVAFEQGVFVSHLGVFDSHGNGLASGHSVGIFDRTTGDAVVQIVTAPGTGALIDGYRYFELPEDVNLPSGFQGSIVVGYGEGNLDRNGNSHGILSVEPNPIWRADPYINNVGISRYGFDPDGYPNILDTVYSPGPANRYHAGSFTYTPNPEPGTMVLLGAAGAVAGVVRRRRRKAQQAPA